DLPEFVDDTVTDYSRPSPTIASTSAEGQNKDSSTSEDVTSPNPPKPFVKFVKPKDSQPESNDANSSSSSEMAKLTHVINQQTSVVTTAMNVILKQFQATPPPASIKAVKEICGELKAITTRSGLVLDGPFIPMPLPFINPDEDEHVEDTLTDPKLGEFTIKVPPPLVQKAKPHSQRNFVVHQRNSLHPNISYPSRMHKQKQQEKDEV
nr:hypothetical protein [Tanacetum cinerariifolium]